MDYREIVAVTGMGGLYQLLTSKNDGAIVRALADGKTVFVSARKHQLTPLESIEIYTTGENVRLHNVLQKMQEQESATPLPDTKDAKAIQAYFGTVFPDYDESRVYASDLKKMVRWYSLLKEASLLDFSRYNEEEAAGETESPMEAEAPMPLEGQVQVAEAQNKEVNDEAAASQSVEGGNAEDATPQPPAKKARAKKATAETENAEEAPAKKPRAKKAPADTEPADEDAAAPKKAGRKKKTDDAAGE